MNADRGWIERSFWPGWVLLAVVLAVAELTNVDLWLQDHFFDFRTETWLVNARAPVPRFFFYNGPKVAIIALGVTLLVLALGRESWRRGLDRRALLVAFATIASVPALVGFGKQWTNVFCPSELRRYGGDVPYVKLWEAYPADDRPERCGECFPAGHASGGFALLGLVGLARTRRGQRHLFLAAMAVGWAMGGYQMLKGAHYLSHTLVTMLLAWLVFLGWRRLLRPPEDGRVNENSSGVHVGFTSGR